MPNDTKIAEVYKSVLDNFPDGVIIANIHNEIVFVNEAAEKTYENVYQTIVSGKGEILGTIVVSRDITEK